MANLVEELAMVNPERQAIVVLGMHRSGTSALAGLFGKLGFELPATIMGATKDNLAGYFESKIIADLNDEILQAHGSAWSDIHPFLVHSDRNEDNSRRARAERMIQAEFGNSQRFVLKDPRICRLLPFWQGVLNAVNTQPKYIHIHRNPLEVAHSLLKRDKFPLKYGLALWLRHMLDAEHYTRGQQRIFVRYEDLLADWRALARRVEKDLDTRLRYTSGVEIDQFLNSELRNFSCDETISPSNNLLENSCYAIFEDWARTCEKESNFHQLDGMRDAIDSICDLQYREYGEFLSRDNLNEEADEAFAKACRIAPHKALNHVARGVALIGAQKFAQAHACMRLALNCEPEARSIHALLSSTSLALGALALADHHALNALDEHEARPLETDALAQSVLNAAILRAGAQQTSLELSMAATNALENDVLDAMRKLEIGQFELGLFELASLIEANLDDENLRGIFIRGIIRFRKEAAPGQFEAFTEALNLNPFPAIACTTVTNSDALGSIDIVIPVYNALEDLKICISSIRKWKSSTMGQIILVDDASEAETRDWLMKQAHNFPDIKVIRNVENLGFTRAVMAGIEASSAPFFVLLNSDTIVTAGWLEGMLRVAMSSEKIALVGPLSNNSYFQSIYPVPCESPNITDDPDRVAAMVLSRCKYESPVVPLLSGFCLLVRRDVFEEVNRLDDRSFPEGYWEVQDLCLRLKDAGFESAIADSVYVHHSGSKSIASSRKKRLVAQGLKIIHERHSALRFQTAEALCALEPVVLKNYQALSLLEAELAQPTQMPEIIRPFDVNAIICRVIKMPPDPLIGAEVCLFVIHAPLGTVCDYTAEYVRALKSNNIAVLICMTTDTMNMPVDAAVLSMADGLVVRQNGGFDFAAWRDMLHLFPEAWRSERLYFVNDSLIGPFAPLDEMIADIRETNAGFFALSECTVGGYHAQSFFFGWNRLNLSSAPLREFWERVEVERDKTQVIIKYEHTIAPMSATLPDPTVQIVYGMQRVLGGDPSEISNVNPTHHGWRRLLKNGFHFVKTDLLRDLVHHPNYVDTQGWEEWCTDHGADVSRVRRHIEQSRINRLLNKSLW
ncbi:glycosyltransferase [bacterium]|nr:glycosyltransferase [bacterium]